MPPVVQSAKQPVAPGTSEPAASTSRGVGELTLNFTGESCPSSGFSGFPIGICWVLQCFVEFYNVLWGFYMVLWGSAWVFSGVLVFYGGSTWFCWGSTGFCGGLQCIVGFYRVVGFL